MVLFTLGFAIKAWQTLGKIIYNYHALFAIPTLCCVFFSATGGVATRSMLRRTVWNTRRALQLKRVHMTFGYLILLAGTCAAFFGMYYYRTNPKHPSNFQIEWLHIGSYVVVLGFLEFRFRQQMKQEDPFKNGHKIITIEEFENLIVKGEKLVILDDLVLDVSKFYNSHPGGHFSILQNVGRDISKFFYGGYSLENRDKVGEHVHSNDARKAVNSIIAYYLDRKADTYQVKIQSYCKANECGSI